MDIQKVFKTTDFHEFLTNKLEPTEYMLCIIMDHRYLLDGINYSINVNDENKHKAIEIISQVNGNVFIVSESINIKTNLKKTFGSRVRFVDHNKFLDFFMASMTEYCITPDNDELLIMASHYGGIPIYTI